MKPISKSFDELCHKDKCCGVQDLFLLCSSVFLVVCSAISIIKFITNYCCQRYEYKYDCGYGNRKYGKYDRYDKYDKYSHDEDNCNCGCSDSSCDCD